MTDRLPASTDDADLRALIHERHQRRAGAPPFALPSPAETNGFPRRNSWLLAAGLLIAGLAGWFAFGSGEDDAEPVELLAANAEPAPMSLFASSACLLATTSNTSYTTQPERSTRKNTIEPPVLIVTGDFGLPRWLPMSAAGR